MSTILNLIEQGKASRLGAVLADHADDLNKALAAYDAVEKRREAAIEKRDSASGEDTYDALHRFHDTTVDLNDEAAEILDAVVAILRAEG